jgi:SAM-dependent methyltransferase
MLHRKIRLGSLALRWTTMEDPDRSTQRYSLGSHADELERLDHQAAAIERPTRVLLQAAGITSGMRVLDLGTGLGHVARMAGEMVGPTGSVLGIDQSADAIAVAQQRTRDAGASQVTFLTGDVTTWQTDQRFDAIVGRLVLFHVPDPAALVRRQIEALHPGGRFVALDFDLGGTRAEPRVDVVTQAVGWVEDAFRAAGAWPRIGARLGTILGREGLIAVNTFGIQAYLSSDDSSGARLLAGVVRSLAPVIIRHGIASAEDLGLSTLEARIAEQVRAADAVILPPTVVGAWGQRR